VKNPQDHQLEKYLGVATDAVRAPHGFTQRVMEAVYRESLAVPTSRLTVSRMYRRLGLSFMLTAAVLAASLLVPHGAYPTLISSGADAALGVGSAATVQNALLGAGHAVQGALGEAHIGGNQE
jgi:hypothetical protein